MASIPEDAAKRLNEFLEGLRKQAPAARMIGKFAVQQATAEAQRLLASRKSPDQPNNSDSNSES
jgi:hypothetical protein